MGNWNINIQGIGCHHNGKPEIDADLAAAAFVEVLKKQGHTIESATFTHGAAQDLMPELAIKVNGVDKTYRGSVLRYEDALTIAGYERHRVLSVTVVNPNERGAILSPGRETAIRNGALIDVYDTSNA